jgi:hypothetical protein
MKNRSLFTSLLLLISLTSCVKCGHWEKKNHDYILSDDRDSRVIAMIEEVPGSGIYRDRDTRSEYTILSKAQDAVASSKNYVLCIAEVPPSPLKEIEEIK